MPNTAIPDGFASTNGSTTVTVVLRDRVVTEREVYGVKREREEGFTEIQTSYYIAPDCTATSRIPTI